MADLGRSVATDVLLSDRVLDDVLGFLLVRAIRPGGDTSVENLARWDLKAALIFSVAYVGKPRRGDPLRARSSTAR